MTVTSFTEDAISEFRKQGILYPIPVLTAGEASEYRSGCDKLEEALGGRPRTVEVRQMHRHFRWAYDLCMNHTILDHIEPLLGPDVVVWATELFAKHPGDANTQIGWHRDGGYMGFAPENVLTAWVALSDSVIENGCMQAIPGPDRFEGTDLLEPDPGHRVPENAIDKERAIPIELQAGEMSLHDSLILHGSAPNLSGKKRVGFAIRYVKADAKPIQGRPVVMPARGEIRGDQFEIAQPPKDSESALAELKRSAVEHFDTILVNLEKSTPA